MPHHELARARWRKSSHSQQQGACVEIARVPATVAVRDSKDPNGPVLAFTATEWKAFTRRVKNGRLA